MVRDRRVPVFRDKAFDQRPSGAGGLDALLAVLAKLSCGYSPFLGKLQVELEVADAGLGDVRLELELFALGLGLLTPAAATGRG